MLSTSAKNLLDLRCADLELTMVEHNTIARHAFEQQARSGIQGSAAANTVCGYFDFFKGQVRAVHEGAIAVISASDPADDLDAIPGYIDNKIRPFLDTMQAKVVAISTAPFSPSEPNLQAVYTRLRTDFEFSAGVAIGRRRTERPSVESYHVHGPNLGQVGHGNRQDVRTGGANSAPKAEKSGVLKNLIYPIIVGVTLLVVGVLIHSQGGTRKAEKFEDQVDLLDLQAIAGYNVFGNTSGKFNGVPVVRTPLNDWSVSFVSREHGNLIWKCDEKTEQLCHAALLRVPRFPFAHFFLAVGMKQKGDQSWRHEAEIAAEVFGKTTKLAQHSSDHDEFLKATEALLKE